MKEPNSFEISASRDARKRELGSALQKGKTSIVSNLIKQGALEEYYHGIYNKKESNALSKIKKKVEVLSILLELQLVSVSTNSYDTRHLSNKQTFNVTLIPGTDLSVRLLINLTSVKDESLATKGNFPLHYICSLPDVEPEVVKIFLDYGTVKIDEWDLFSYKTALINAVLSGNFNLVKFLIANGADINNSVRKSLNIGSRKDHKFDFMNIFTRKPLLISGNNVTISAVLAAAYDNHPQILWYLLENGGDVTENDGSWFLLLRPAHEGHAEVVEILLKHGIDINTKGPFGSTTLNRVAETGNIEMAKLLLMYGADLNLTNDFGWTPLHVAAFFGINSSKPFVKLLLDSGCDINALTDGGFTPLNLAEAGSNPSFLEYLIKNSDYLKFDKDQKEQLGESENHESHAKTLQLLLNHGAELNHQDDILGWTTLHWAAANGNLMGVKLLVEEYEAATNVESKLGMTPLKLAKHFGREAVSKYLNTVHMMKG